MPNLKLDLVNKLNNEKYYDELELIRLAQEPNINYKQKINDMTFILQTIALLNAEIGLVEQYFKEPEPQKEQVPVEGTPVVTPKESTHPGQSHGE